MKTPSIEGICLAGLMSVVISLSAGSQRASVVTPLAQANNAFAIDFYGHARSKPGNLLFSPYSLSAAFAMTYAGSGGETASQMQRTMHWGVPAEKVAADFADLDRMLDKDRGGAVQLRIANALWPQKGYRFRREYLDLLGTTFKTAIHEADFRSSPDAERARINRWVGQQTNERIKELMPPGSVNRDSRLVLANAVYFKAKWQDPFVPSGTQSATFYLPSGGALATPMMNRLGQYKHTSLPGAKMLAMPYQGGKLSMLVLLPDEVSGMPQLEKELSVEKLDSWIKALQPKRVNLFLPKFKASFQLDLSQALEGLGMADAFSVQKADFTGMTGGRDLYISAALHKAFAEITEEGTEAAAATGIMMAPTSIVTKPPEEPIIFRADHPFIYLIRHDPSGAILFIGRLNDPKT